MSRKKKKKIKMGRTPIDSNDITVQLAFKAGSKLRLKLEKAVDRLNEMGFKQKIDQSKLLRAIVIANVDDAVDLYIEQMPPEIKKAS